MGSTVAAPVQHVAAGTRTPDGRGTAAQQQHVDGILVLQGASGNHAVVRLLAGTSSPSKDSGQRGGPGAHRDAGRRPAPRDRLFVRGAGDADEVMANDAEQGQLNDCSVISAAAAIADADPNAIRRMIKDNGDGSYEVTLILWEKTTGRRAPRVIPVSGPFPTSDGKPLYAQFGDERGNERELWVMVIEKAVAIAAGGYDKLDQGMEPAVGMMAMAPGTAETYKVSAWPAGRMLAHMEHSLGSRMFAVVAGTHNRNPTPAEEAEVGRLGLVFGHAYTVMRADAARGTLDLRNPQGVDHLANLPVETFRRYFDYWHVMRVRDKPDGAGPSRSGRERPRR